MKRSTQFLVIGILLITLGACISQLTVSKSNNALATNIEPHFSVRWMGFGPDGNASQASPYSDTYNNYCVCISDVPSQTLNLPIALKLVNQEDSGFYFRISSVPNPPTGWTLPEYDLGLVSKDETRYFSYSALRAKPTLISEGSFQETIALTLQAYYDAQYTQFYSQDSFTVTFVFLDRQASVWHTLSSDNFDNSMQTGWTGNWAAIVGDFYHSWPHSLRLFLDNYESTGFKKTVTVNESYTEAYLVASIRCYLYGSNYFSPWITFNGTTYFEPDNQLKINTWYQLTIPLPVNQTTQVTIWCYGARWSDAYCYLDDAYIIAK